MPLSDADKIINLEDLAAFKVKMDESVLHKVGVETVSGEKIFSGIQTTVSGNESALMVIKDPVLVKGETPESIHFLSLGFIDSTGNSYAQDQEARLGVFEYRSPSVSSPVSYVQMADFGFYKGAATASIQVGHDADGIMFARAPATSNERTVSTDIVTRGYLEVSEWNWQKTPKAESVTFVPVPESDLEPVVDFVFAETPPAEGEKGPDNPGTIAGVSSITVTRCQRRGVASTNYIIPLEDTYYGGSLDVATGVLTVTHYGYAFTGAESGLWERTELGNTVRFGAYGSSWDSIIKVPKNLNTQVCSHFTFDYSYDSDAPHFYVGTTEGNQYYFYPDNTLSIDGWKAWLAQQYADGHPLTVSFELATPFTVQLTPVQIKSLAVVDKYVPRPNMVYSDQQAVQVGYQRFYDENRLAALEARIAALEGS